MDREIDYQKLRDFRVDKNIKQKEIAARLNITPSAYNRIENGNRGLRVEQLKVIAEILGKNINEFFKNRDSDNPVSSTDPQILKSEIQLLQSVLCVISAEVESELFSILRKYDEKYPDYPISFNEYLNDFIITPDEVVQVIKGDIQTYVESGGVLVDEAVYSLVKGGIEYFFDRDDKWLKDFVTKEENYSFVQGVALMPETKSDEDSYSAFKDMINEEPIVRILFQYGLLEESWFSSRWKKYLQDMNSTLTGDGARAEYDFEGIFDTGKPLIDVTNQKRKNREKIREIMKNILSPTNKKDLPIIRETTIESSYPNLPLK